PVCHDPENDGSCGPSAHTAATPACGASCVEFSTALYGTASNPAFVLANVPQAQNIGQPITLAHPSNANPGEDFTASFQGLVSDFIASGLMSTGMSIYNNLGAIEIEYAPLGVSTGLCVGVRVTPANGTVVDLEPCGVTVKTVWISDSRLTGPDLPLINGA